MKDRNGWASVVVLRGILGMIAVYFCNSFLAAAGYPLTVGIGVINAAVTGILGIPGILLLYGIDFCSALL